MKRRKILNNKKGMSIVEVVVAMTVLIIITVSTLSVAFSSTTITNNAYLRFKAVNQIADIIEVYKVSSSKDDFNKYIGSLYEGEYTYAVNGELVFVSADLTVYIQLLNNGIRGRACYTHNEREIYSTSYVKGEAFS